jgi:hypothetical protein
MKSEMRAAFSVGKHGGGTPFGDRWDNWEKSVETLWESRVWKAN